MYNSPVASGNQINQNSQIKQIALIAGYTILSILILVELWAFMWIACALGDVCYVASGGALN
tara:strand:- start:158 stop:343 length:186 start_codon:yes stop_codon:yes gene_type:complete